MTYYNDPAIPRFQEPDYNEPATRNCECGEEIYDDEATDCDDCIQFICEECGEYNENIIKVAPHENYCPDCFEDFE